MTKYILVNDVDCHNFIDKIQLVSDCLSNIESYKKKYDTYNEWVIYVLKDDYFMSIYEYEGGNK